MIAEKQHDEMGGMFGVVLRVGRLAGVAPLSFYRDGEAKISRGFGIYSILLVILLDGFLCRGLVNIIFLPSQNKESSAGKFYQLPALIILSSVAYIILVSLGIFRGANRMTHILSYINKIKQIRLTINKPHLFEAQQISIFLVVVLICGDWLLTLSIMWFDGFDMYNLIIARLLANVIINLIELQFISVVKFLNATFKNINNCLEKLYQQPAPIRSYRFKNALEIRRMMLAFVSTCQTVKEFNKCENIYLLLQLTISTTDILIALFRWSEALDIKGNLEKKIFFMTFNSFVCLYHISRIALLVQPCQQTVEEVKRTQFLVSQNMSRVMSEEDPASPELDVFYHQLILNEPSYIVIDVFKLERPLISAIISGVITILLMIY